jgi:hypothetical protein
LVHLGGEHPFAGDGRERNVALNVARCGDHHELGTDSDSREATGHELALSPRERTCAGR